MKLQTPAEFIQNTSQEDIRMIQILVGALMLGVFFFAFVIILVAPFDIIEPAGSQVEPIAPVLTWLTYSTFFLSIVSVPVSMHLFKSRLNSGRDSEDPILLLRSAYLVRLAILNGTAFLGLVTIMMAVVDLQFMDNPLLWVNALPVFIFFFVSLLRFPTKGQILKDYDTYIFR